MKNLVAWAVVVSVSMLISGCAGTGEVIQPPMTDSGPKGEYVIGVGDQLSISVWRNPELSIAVPVRPDGRISTPLVGDIVALGQTPEGLSEIVKKKLTQYVRNPEVTIIVTSPRSVEYADRVRVLGAVNNPRSLIFRDGMTVLDVILESGGVSEFAAANKAVLYRADASGEKKAYPLYLDDILTKGKLETNFTLQALDIITVPERAF